jgi:glycosyltransferase involved in cell wall biosynthesis
MISIIIPVYNGEKTLIDTIKSIENQSYTNLEIIIVNDGSEDKTVKVFEDFCQKNELKHNYFFINQANKGAPAARNRGRREAQGDFLLFCDADAVLKPEALEEMLKALKSNPEASYAYSSFYWGKKLFKLWPFDSEKLKKMPCIHTMSLIRKKDFPKEGWDEKIKKLQDWDLWLTMLENGHKGVFIDKILIKIKPGGTISSWLPSFTYKLLPFLPLVKKYKKALKVIREKHNLK